MRIAHPRLRPLRHSTVGAATPLPRRDARAPIIEAVKVGKRFGGSVALFDVSIAFEAGEIHALVGENGAGKTTLTGILAGVHIPDRGTVHLDGNEVHFSSPHQAIGAGIGLIHQELSLVLGLTVGANVFLGREPRTGRGTINDRAIRRSTSELLDRLGASFRSNDLVGDLSVSDQQLVEIARVVARAPRVLIMDEPTASLAASNVERVFDVVRGVRDEGVAVIYISHELDEVFALADRVTVLKDGRITMSSPVGSTNRSEVVRRMVGRELNEVFPPRASVPAGDAALEVEGLSLPGHFEDVTFAVHRGEVLGFAGLVGSGRSALVQSLFGAPPPPLGPRDVRGTVKVGGRVVRIGSTRQAARLGLGLVPEERKTEGVLLERSVTENIVLPQLSELSRHGVLRRAEQTRVCEGEMRRLRILAPSPKALVRMLSGGNQQKVVLGKWLARKHAVLLLDEPTRGVDIGAKTEIYELIRKLANDGAAIVVISSSLPEILGISDRILVMSKGRLVSEHFPATATEDDLIAAAFGLLEEERSTDVH